MRDALGRARADRRPLDQDHLSQAADRIVPAVDAGLLDRIAVHEAGHTLVSLLSSLPTPRAVRVSAKGGDVELQALPLLTPELARDRLRTMLAGRAAEICVYGTPTSGAGAGEGSDLAQATGLALAIEQQWGFGACGLTWSPVKPQDLPCLAPALIARVDAHLRRAQADAMGLLRARIPDLLQLRDRLLREREIDRAGLEEFRQGLVESGEAAAVVPIGTGVAGALAPSPN